MSRYCLPVLFVAVLSAQDAADLFNKPPADVDKALRERIGQFYQYHVTKEYRKAEALVAEDTKDFFYERNKPVFLDYEIRKIVYSDNYTKAKAEVFCNMFVPVPGFADRPIKMPVPSTWKVEKDGLWYWYIDQSKLAESPFGTMKAGPPLAPGQKLTDLFGAGAPPAIPDTPDAFLNKVIADKTKIALKVGTPEQITFTNTAPGPMFVSVGNKIDGIEAAFNETNLKGGDKAVLTLKAAKGAKSGTLNIRIEPTGEIVPLEISVH
jgi:hypothetical protein